MPVTPQQMLQPDAGGPMHHTVLTHHVPPAPCTGSSVTCVSVPTGSPIPMQDERYTTSAVALSDLPPVKAEKTFSPPYFSCSARRQNTQAATATVSDRTSRSHVHIRRLAVALRFASLCDEAPEAVDSARDGGRSWHTETCHANVPPGAYLGVLLLKRVGQKPRSRLQEGLRTE